MVSISPVQLHLSVVLLWSDWHWQFWPAPVFWTSGLAMPAGWLYLSSLLTGTLIESLFRFCFSDVENHLNPTDGEKMMPCSVSPCWYSTLCPKLPKKKWNFETWSAWICYKSTFTPWSFSVFLLFCFRALHIFCILYHFQLWCLPCGVTWHISYLCRQTLEGMEKEQEYERCAGCSLQGEM